MAKGPNKTKFTIRFGKTGKVSTTSRQKIGNATITRTRSSNGKVRTTTSMKSGNITYSRTR